jgi:hypothetical protein
MQCLAENGRLSIGAEMADYFDDGIAVVECSAGHKTALVMQSQKFEMLLDSGSEALLEGFTLEACASFAAALERFYDFALRVAFVGRQLSPELYDKMFKQMASQSERQLGAFMLLHVLEFGSAYSPKTSIVETRNAVIHKGHIPTIEKATAFCAEIYETIYNLFSLLRTKYRDAITLVIGQVVGTRQTKVQDGVRPSVVAGGNLFSIVNEEHASSFSEALAAGLTSPA